MTQDARRWLARIVDDDMDAIGVMDALERREAWVERNAGVLGLIASVLDEAEQVNEVDVEADLVREISAHVPLTAGIRMYHAFPDATGQAVSEDVQSPEQNVLAQRILLLVRLHLYGRIFSRSRRRQIRRFLSEGEKR